MSTPSPRLLRRFVVALLVATVAVVGLPTPAFTLEHELGLDTERPVLAPRSVAWGPAAAGSPPGRVGTTRVTDEFRLLGVTWSGDTDAAVRLRVRRDGTWDDWFVIERSDDQASPSEAAPITDSGPIWVDRADAYEIDAPSTVTDVRVNLVRERSARVRLSARTATAGAAARSVTIGSRSSWGARAPKSSPTIASGVKIAIVHHTAGANDYAKSSVPSILRGIQTYHMDSNGWADIGYNFLVDRFGGVWEGRSGGIGKAVVGAHAGGFNTGTTGIALMGNHTEGTETGVPVTSAAEAAVTGLVAWKLPHHGVDPSGRTTLTSGGSSKYPSGQKVTLDNVTGHRSVSSTACPGDHGFGIVGDVADGAAADYAFMRAYNPHFLGGSFVASGDLDGDGDDEVVTGADSGGGPHVKAFDSHTTRVASFMAFGHSVPNGTRVAIGQLDSGLVDVGVPSGTSDPVIVVGSGIDAPSEVRLFDADGTLRRSWSPYSFEGGVWVTTGDVIDSSPGDEVITGVGPGGGPHVKIWSPDGVALASFFAFESGFTGGVDVAVADLDDDGDDEFWVSRGPGTASEIRSFAFAGITNTPLRLPLTISPYTPAFRGGAYVSAVRRPGPDALVTTPGDGGGPHVKVFDESGSAYLNWFPFPADLRGGARFTGASFDDDVVLVGIPGPGSSSEAFVFDAATGNRLWR